ncbi:hypothetical protein FSP39_006103 [Pinctada imbricata]|uniref:Folliculin n=1 Tax=Pinctada imbricata TaxID=66713 RepID=A0AA89BSS4_PINIB|nr:hypothetical protein FSP39_006103 [Pinctada imbricata]
MNAIISLCHFCELHGPQVLFCTQPHHPLERTSSSESDDTVTGVEGGATRRVKSPSVSSDPLSPTSTGPKNDSCEGCSSVRTGFISKDEEAQVHYISCKQPFDREVYSMSRQACIRSLSGEVCPGRDGPIFFGNEQLGHVLSYTFHIKDSQARGFQKKYSILVVMMDKIYLLNSWPFLVPHLKIVIDHIEKKANIVYEREEIKCPQRAHRLQSSIHPVPLIHHKPARSLVELTDDKHIFKLLHLAFVWILKACANRITETLLEGPPTEDSIIDMEKQEETEEGFCLLFSRKIGTDDVEEAGHGEEAVNIPPRGGEEEEEEEDGDGPIIKNTRHAMKILGQEKFHILAHHVVIGNQIIVRGAPKSLVKSFLSALKPLLPKGCCRMIGYSNMYEESWRCNFLGLTPDVTIPKHIMSNEAFVLLDITPLSEEEAPDFPADIDSLNRYSFNMASPSKLSEKTPSVLQKMKMTLRNENLTQEVVEQYLICLKEEWMNKVKVLFKFTKAGGSRTEEDTKKLLQVVGANPEDTPILKFWMEGLSVQYRNHIFTASKSQH